MDNISWLGVLAGTVALFVLGGLWFTVLFGKAYRAVLGVPEPSADDAPQTPPISALAGQFVTGLVMTVILAWLIGESTAAHGAGLGVAAGLLVAVALGQFYLFEGKTLRHLAISGGYIVVGLTAVGAILGALQ